MSSKRTLDPDKPRRIPRKGLHFLLVRSAGFMFKVIGLLLFPMIGCVGGLVAGIGFGLSYLGTQASVSDPLSGPDQVQMD